MSRSGRAGALRRPRPRESGRHEGRAHPALTLVWQKLDNRRRPGYAAAA